MSPRLCLCDVESRTGPPSVHHGWTRSSIPFGDKQTRPLLDSSLPPRVLGGFAASLCFLPAGLPDLNPVLAGLISSPCQVASIHRSRPVSSLPSSERVLPSIHGRPTGRTCPSTHWDHRGVRLSLSHLTPSVPSKANPPACLLLVFPSSIYFAPCP